MRESGFDVSFRFGPFGSATHYYAPVCLNSLLYKTEKDLEQMSRWLGHSADAEKWEARAQARKKMITRYLWDDKSGFFFDFNFQTGTRSSYRYATSFYPLWAGLATPQHAKAVGKSLPALGPPGRAASRTGDSGAELGLPYGSGETKMHVAGGLVRHDC